MKISWMYQMWKEVSRRLNEKEEILKAIDMRRKTWMERSMIHKHSNFKREKIRWAEEGRPRKQYMHQAVEEIRAGCNQRAQGALWTPTQQSLGALVCLGLTLSRFYNKTIKLQRVYTPTTFHVNGDSFMILIKSVDFLDYCFYSQVPTQITDPNIQRNIDNSTYSTWYFVQNYGVSLVPVCTTLCPHICLSNCVVEACSAEAECFQSDNTFSLIIYFRIFYLSDSFRLHHFQVFNF